MILRNITIGLAITSVIVAFCISRANRKLKREHEAQGERLKADKKISDEILRKLNKKGRA